MRINPFLLVVALLGQGCAVLHHVQVGEVDARSKNRKRFEVKVSEVGVDLDDASRIARLATRDKKGGKVFDYAQYLQMGPRTGSPVYDEDYANEVLNLIYRECPSGKITGVMSVREQAKYSVISGEIIKITGWCLG